MIEAVHIKSIEDFDRDPNGYLIVRPNTTYVIGNPLSISFWAKRKVKRFNKARYQKVLLSIKGLKPQPMTGVIVEDNNVL